MQTKYLSKHGKRLSQLLKGAVVVTFCQNEAEVKCQMDIDSHISLTEQVIKLSTFKVCLDDEFS